MKKIPQTTYMLIDVTSVETTTIIAVAPLRIVELLGQIQTIKGRKVVAPPLEGRGFAKLDKLALQYLYWNMLQQTPPEDYQELIKSLLAKVAETPVSDATVEQLERELALLAPLEDPSTAKAPKDPNAPPTRPKGMTTTGLVWEICDRLYMLSGNVMPERKAVMDTCAMEEINLATAATQFAKWKKAKMSPSI